MCNNTFTFSECFKSVEFDRTQEDFQTTLGHERYDNSIYLESFFGESESEQQSRFENLLLTVVSRYFLSIKWENKEFSGFHAMELLVSILARINSVETMIKYKYVISPLFVKFLYFLDDMFFKAYEFFGTTEQSLQMADAPIFISLRQHRLLMIELFCLMVSVSTGQRKTVVASMNPRLLDINMLWIKEKLDNSFVMVGEINADQVLSVHQQDPRRRV